jgi:hypothetical protein
LITADDDFFRQAYDAFNRRDIDQALAAMHEDVIWANGLDGGFLYGRENVRVYWTDQWATFDPHVEPIRVEYEGPDRAVVTVHQVVRDLFENILADQVVEHVYEIDDGLIRRLEIRSV